MQGKRGRRVIISNRFAVFSITLFLLASIAGWIFSEIIPQDFLLRPSFYKGEWGDTIFRLVMALKLYAPFHSIWYETVLVFFFITLLLCVITNARKLLRPYFESPPGPVFRWKGSGKKWNSLELSWRYIVELDNVDKDPFLYFGERFGKKGKLSGERLKDVVDTLSNTFSSLGYRWKSFNYSDSFVFLASKGELRYVGNFALHIAILIIAVGGIIGSFYGWSEVMYGRAGDMIPVGDTGTQIRVEDFNIVLNEDESISDYITDVSVWKNGDSLGVALIKVNQPLKLDGINVLQHSYHTEEDEYYWARIGYRIRGEFSWKNLLIKPGEKVFLADSAFSFKVIKFLPDLRVYNGKVYTKNGFPYNPAVKVELEHFNGVEYGWIFLRHPEFNKNFKAPISLVLEDVKPVFYTGLQVTSNPGSPLIIGGIFVATVALILLLLFDYRKITGEVSPFGLYIKGAHYRWKESFKKEFENMARKIVDDLHGSLKGVALDESDD